LRFKLDENMPADLAIWPAKEGYTVSQFLASAASEKLAVLLTMDYLRREASAGRREDFDNYLAAVPDVASPKTDHIE
jgi:hypothetical protein